MNEDLNKGMYDVDGNFMPFVGNHGNVDGDISSHRNTFLEAEREYFSFLFQSHDIREKIKEMILTLRPEDIFAKAQKLQERLESGELEDAEDKKLMQSMTPEQRDLYHLSKLEEAEGVICVLLASVRDKALILERILTFEQELSNGGRSASR